MARRPARPNVVATVEVPCSEARHTISLLDTGRIVLNDHPHRVDTDSEIALVVLDEDSELNDLAGCYKWLLAWRKLAEHDGEPMFFEARKRLFGDPHKSEMARQLSAAMQTHSQRRHDADARLYQALQAVSLRERIIARTRDTIMSLMTPPPLPPAPPEPQTLAQFRDTSAAERYGYDHDTEQLTDWSDLPPFKDEAQSPPATTALAPLFAAASSEEIARRIIEALAPAAGMVVEETTIRQPEPPPPPPEPEPTQEPEPEPRCHYDGFYSSLGLALSNQIEVAVDAADQYSAALMQATDNRDVDRYTLYIHVPFNWLSRVYAKGLAVVDGKLALNAWPVEPRPRKLRFLDDLHSVAVMDYDTWADAKVFPQRVLVGRLGEEARSSTTIARLARAWRIP